MRAMDDAHRQARTIMRARARTFYLSSLFLPHHVRRDVCLAYAYFRTIDDLVDEPLGLSRCQVLNQLDAWQSVIEGTSAPFDPLSSEIIGLLNRHGLPHEILLMMIDGARLDLDLQRLETVDDLVHYSVLVAGSVGMVMSYLLEARAQRAIAAARDLGVAMQLTNVLRDVGEDLERGRVYLPRAEMRRVGCSEDVLWARTVTPEFRILMQNLVCLAREHYERGMDGISDLHPSAQFSIYLAARLYAQILVKIERRDFDVFSRRASLGPIEKWLLTLPAYAQHRQSVHRA